MLSRVRDSSGNPLRNAVKQRLQRIARPEVFTEGHAQKQKTLALLQGFYLNS